MTIFRYVLRYNTGLAPCFQFGLFSLALCKPNIRKSAKVGDWLLGYASTKGGREKNRLLYAAKITKIVTMGVYMGREPARADQIYSRDGAGKFQHNGRSEHHKTAEAQTRDWSCNRVLLSKKFRYFGDSPLDTCGSPIEALYYAHCGHKASEPPNFDHRAARRFLRALRKSGQGIRANF